MAALLLGIMVVFLCIMLIVNSALSSKRLVGVVARHHELTTEYANKIKELESSPLFDCEKGKHYWGLWEDVSAESERVVQKRRCGECNKVEFSGVVAGESLKTSSPNTELLAEKVNASNLFLEKLQSKTTKKMPKKKSKSVTETVDHIVSGDVFCEKCEGWFSDSEFAGAGDSSRHIPPDIGSPSHSPNKPPSESPEKKVSARIFCKYCYGYYPREYFFTATSGKVHHRLGVSNHDSTVPYYTPANERP